MSDKPICDSCQFPAEGMKEYPMGPGRHSGKTKLLCTLCANTMAGTAVSYPEQFRETQVVMQCICFVGNTILEAIRGNIQDR